MFELNRSIDRLDVGTSRHWIALALIAVLVAVLGRQIFAPDLPVVVRGLLIVLSLSGAWLLLMLARRGPASIELTEVGLVAANGAVICEFSNIAKIEHGALAFKPSKGFLIRLKSPMSPGWHPGLWWRYGTRVGIGGMTPAAETKLMAEVLAERFPPGPAEPA